MQVPAAIAQLITKSLRLLTGLDLVTTAECVWLVCGLANNCFCNSIVAIGTRGIDGERRNIELEAVFNQVIARFVFSI